jgi:osmotically-inducible protein OsmY
MKTYTVKPLIVRPELLWGPRIKEASGELPVRYSVPFKQSDENLGLNAANALKQNPSVPPNRVNIRVQAGVITLSGELDWEYQKFAAGQAVLYFRGVISINNQITIRPRTNSRW